MVPKGESQSGGGGGVLHYAEARTETQFGLIWLHTTSVSVSSVPPSTDSKTTTRTAANPVSYHSPILTS